ncbi:MAG: hypothetical protein V4625_13400 [Pseudomonadota bacterium]
MRVLLPFALVAVVSALYGCPDTKIPKAPPKIPEPKATGYIVPTAVSALHASAAVCSLGKAQT